eukprot:CAMPEP_0113663434 /NCGR_PEP_ID=MMETSP0038_2-20120614/1140_1 /TAXON_ID=2898 /ORGANISM="Cryptomonas paramecium" /LENGTH=207 /DNA_ID=CAMNT_0000578461 /DNA_START=88 /DNA_END=708 /DNA_ORIENTATION=- /assembly_acc=CAM_ASM_000170
MVLRAAIALLFVDSVLLIATDYRSIKYSESGPTNRLMKKIELRGLNTTSSGRFSSDRSNFAMRRVCMQPDKKLQPVKLARLRGGHEHEIFDKLTLLYSAVTFIQKVLGPQVNLAPIIRCLVDCFLAHPILVACEMAIDAILGVPLLYLYTKVVFPLGLAHASPWMQTVSAMLALGGVRAAEAAAFSAASGGIFSLAYQAGWAFHRPL